MSKSLVAQIQEVIGGQHVMGADGLTDYHAARKVRDCKRVRDRSERVSAMKRALKNYRVTVSLDWESDAILVANRESGLTVIL